MNPDDPDAELMARLGRQEPAAAREMVARKLPRLLALASRILGNRSDAEEVAQEAFIRIWKQAGRWQAGQARVDTWLHTVVLNLCRDRMRRAHARLENSADEGFDPIDPAPQPHEQWATAARGQEVGAALAALPARQREALVLHYYQELSNGQAAELMGISVDALESLLARARRNMRAQLIGADDVSRASATPDAAPDAAPIDGKDTR